MRSGIERRSTDHLSRELRQLCCRRCRTSRSEPRWSPHGSTCHPDHLLMRQTRTLLHSTSAYFCKFLEKGFGASFSADFITRLSMAHRSCPNCAGALTASTLQSITITWTSQVAPLQRSASLTYQTGSGTAAATESQMRWAILAPFDSVHDGHHGLKRPATCRTSSLARMQAVAVA